MAISRWLLGALLPLSLGCPHRAEVVDGQPDAAVVATDLGGTTPADFAGLDASMSFACPLVPPVDLDDPKLVDCLEPILVGVGDRTRRIVSFDGTTWLDDQLDSGNTIGDMGYDDGALGVAFGKGYIVTASDFGIFTSADRGHTWAKAPAPAPQHWGQGVHVSVALWNGKRFVIVSEGVSFTSDDGFTFTRHDLTTIAGDHLAFSGWAVGANGRIAVSGGQHLMNLSDDGVAWRTVEATYPVGFSSMAYGNGVFVAVATSARAYSTDNGETWTVLTDDCTLNDPSRCIRLPTKVQFVNGKFIFGTWPETGTAHLLQSANGVDWTVIGDGLGFDWNHVSYKGTDYAVHSDLRSDTKLAYYRTGTTMVGPFTDHDWPGNPGIAIANFGMGLVLKRP